MISRNLKLLIALLIVGTIAGYVILVVIPTQLTERAYKAAQTLGEDFRKAFQFTPEVTVNKTVVLNQQTNVFELAVLAQNFEHRYTWTHSWMGSTKKISISGSFDAKVGFDLHEKFSVTITDDKAIVRLNEPKVLSVESKGDIQYRDENGIWNWVDMDDRSTATNLFITDARKYAEQSAFVEDAKAKMEERMKAFFKSHDKEVEIQYTIPIQTESQ
ncbi:MAG TPA: DUF4230 domain-containing protein [Cyclobacteriaceae bacterium]